jgi:hypothetical protein
LYKVRAVVYTTATQKFPNEIPGLDWMQRLNELIRIQEGEDGNDGWRH